MYILIELEELLDLAAMVQSRLDPDTPVDEDASDDGLLKIVSAVLDTLSDADNVEDDLINDLIQQEEILRKAERILTLIFTRLMVRENIRWFRVCDHRGGLAIHVKPGALKCLPAMTSTRS